MRSLRRNAAALLRLVREQVAKYPRWLGAVFVLQLGATIAALYLPTLNADIIDKGVARGDAGYIVRTGGVMLGFSLAQVVCTVAAVYFASRVAMSVGRDVRGRLFRQVESFSSREMTRFGAPSLITRNTNDVQQVQMLVQMGGTFGVMAPIMMVGGVIMALRQDVGLAWLIVVSVTALAIVAASIISRMVPSYRMMQTRIDAVNRILREQITGIRVVRAFVREPYETKRFRVANRELTSTAITAGRWMAAMFPTVLLIVNLSTVGVLWFGGHRVDAGTMQVGSLVAFMNYLLQILMAVMMATFMLVMAPRAAVSADRIMEVAETDSSVVPPAEPVRSLPQHRELRLEHVEFSYPGASAAVLSDVSLVARRGEMTAIVGSTGSGKSTLLNLIPRLYDATGGVVRVDGVDVRRLPPELLWSKIGLVPQSAYLFNGTVRSNLQFGRPDATDDEIWAALGTAQARQFVESMPGGLDAPIAQGGTNVSGGQRQRLAIARALIKRPDIYLFDDAFSALDVATDARLRQALKPITKQSTVVIVAQRVSTILDADEIIVLEHGEVVGSGTHRSLLAENETYQEIVHSQLTEEEAA